MARDTPFVTWTLAVLILAFAWQITGFFPTEEALLQIAWSRDAMAAGEWWRLATSMFAHAGLLHLGFNLVALLAVGPFVERALGPARFVALYVASGIAGSLLHAWATPIPGVGASGAIFGVIGGLLILAPTTRLWILWLIPMPAILAAALYLALVMFVPAFTAEGTIAHMAHLGGMFAGLLFGFASDVQAGLQRIWGVVSVFAGTAAIVLWATVADLQAVASAVMTGTLQEIVEIVWLPVLLAVLTGFALAHLRSVDLGETEAEATK